MERSGSDRVIERLRDLAATWDAENGSEAFPAARLSNLHRIGALRAFTRLADEEDVARLRTALRLVGRVDLGLGRLFEGHVNACQLVAAYGDAAQRATLAADLDAGRVFGVWNTEPAPGLAIAPADGGFRLAGAKSFASGAGHIDRALVTARTLEGGKQLVLVDIAEATGRADNGGWQVRGMRGTASGLFDFTDMIVDPASPIGAPGDYEREPRFSAGAWRFAAVQLGGAEGVLHHWRDHLVATGKAADPIQRARFAAAAAATRSAASWVARAADLAEAARPEAIACVLMTRGVVEEAALAVMEGAARGVGTASFFEGSRIDRLTRDLGLYLRQPVPDQARDRAAAAWIEADCWGDDAWW